MPCPLQNRLGHFPNVFAKPPDDTTPAAEWLIPDVKRRAGGLLAAPSMQDAGDTAVRLGWWHSVTAAAVAAGGGFTQWGLAWLFVWLVQKGGGGLAVGRFRHS